MHLHYSQIVDLTTQLQREKGELTAANETVMQRVEKLSTENGELGVNNVTLKVQVAHADKNTVHKHVYAYLYIFI